MNTSWVRANLFATTALVGVAVAALAGTSAVAADDAASKSASDASAVEEVVVTGSRIPQAGFDTLMPAQTLNADTLKDRGFLNAGDALNEMPVFGPAGANNQGQGSGSQVGQQFVDLYGLGAQRTLVLVDGRRFVSGNAPTPIGSFGGAPPGQEVDLNDIPAGLIDHIEVIGVGGAPTYGADAIAGTVNVILKKNFQGVEAEAQYGSSTQGDGKSYVARVLAGTNFADDKGNVTVSLEYTQQDGLNASNRPNTMPYDVQTDTPGCAYKNCLVPNATVGSITTGGIPTINITNKSLANAGGAIMNQAGQPLAFAPNGNLVPVNLGTQTNELVFSGGGDGDNLASQTSFISPVTRYLVDTLAHYDFTPHIQGYLETEFSQANGEQIAAQPSYQSAFFASQNGEGPLQFSITNPYLTPQAVAALQAALPAGQPNFGLSRANLDLAPTTFTNDITTYRVVGGFKGDFEVFGRKVNWDTSFNYGSSEGRETYYDINEANFLNAIDVVKSPTTGQIECAVTANPPLIPTGYAAQPSSVTGCQPLDLFGAGAPSAAARAFVTAQDEAISLVTQRDVQLNLNGSPFDDWAGPVEFAAGFEFRQEAASYNVDAFASSGLGRDAPTGDVAGSYNSSELYAEAKAPIISPSMHIPFAYSAEFNGSYRYIQNSLAGPANVYTLGGEFRPFEDLELRGNVTHSVRAPSIEELFLPTSSSESFAQDPCNTGNTNGAANRAANCAAAFAALGAPLQGFTSLVQNATVLGTTEGNPNLKDETADSWTIGFVARPHWIPHLSVAVDWVNIYLTNPITSLTLTQTMDACYDAATTVGNPYCSLFTRAPVTGQVTGFSLPLVNAGAQGFSGAQMQSTYSVDINEIPFIDKIHLNPNINYGNLTFELNAFFENSHYQEILGIVTPTRGDIGDPVWKVNGSVRYRIGPLMFYLNGRYISPGKEDVTLPANANQISEVGNYWVWNTALSYDITKRVTMEISVNDVFNQNPPQYAYMLGSFGGDPVGYGAALSTYDYFGQQFVLSLKAKF
jgi:outer membrane receptor protein involved in Fe transport